jgi:hypothetical protein
MQKIQRFKNSRIQKFNYSKIQLFRDSIIPGFKDSGAGGGETVRNAGNSARGAGKKSDASELTPAIRIVKSETPELTLAVRGKNPPLRN